MMDDIRPPRQGFERRDYTAPVRRPAAHVPRPEPVHHPIPVQPAPTPQYHRPALEPVAAPQHHHHAATHEPRHNNNPHGAPKRLGRRYFAVAAAFVLAIGLFTAGYIFKSKAPVNSLPSSVVTKANFNVYFPSPMPSGYIYVNKTATFQIGDVFYRFANGLKSVTVREEPLPAKKPDLSLYKGYTAFSSTVGQAAMGTSFGQPVALVVTPTTVITLNTSGGVTPQDLKSAINNLRNIGSSSQGATNG